MKRPLACLSLAAACTLAMPPELLAAEAVGNRRIERVVQRESWGMGYGGMMVLKYRPIVLFTDHTYTTDADGAVNGKGTIAGRWRERGGGQITFISPDGKERQERTLPGPRPAKPRQTLSGRYSSFSGVGGGGTGTTSVVAWSGFDFAADGSVRVGGGSGSSTPKSDSNASVVTRSAGKRKSARYTLDGYTINFAFDDGSVRKQLFYFMGSKENVIVIGPQTLTKR